MNPDYEKNEQEKRERIREEFLKNMDSDKFITDFESLLLEMVEEKKVELNL